MGNNWQSVKLGDAPLEIIDGDRGGNYPSQNDFFEAGYCLFLNAKNVRLNGFDFSECMFISKEKDGLLRKGKLQRNDIVLTTRGTVGNVAFYSDTIPFDIIRINSGMVIIRPNPDKLLPDFCFYVFKKLQDDFKTFTTGSAQPQLPIKDLSKMEAPLPPLPFQRTIAATLSCLDEKIELNNRINANLEAQAQAIFKSWFVDFEPFRGGEFVESELGKIPNGWNIKALDEICKIKGGKRLPKGVNLITEPNTHPYIRVRDMNNSIFVQNNGTLEYVDDDTQQFISRYIVSDGDIIISIVGTVGLVSKIHESLDKANLTENCVKLTGFDNIFSDYIYLFLTSKEGQDCIKRGTVGAVQAKLPLKNIQSIPLIIPPHDIICDFHNFASISMQQIANNLSENTILTRIREFMLPRLMSGEIEVTSKMSNEENYE